MADLMTTAQRCDLLGSRYRHVRETTEILSAPLSPEDQTVQSMPDVSPTKWHRAHTSWFFETFLLEPSLTGYRSFHPAFAYLFNSYYEGVGARYPRPRRGVVSRPGVAEVAEYRAHVDEAMARLLGRGLTPALDDLVELGLHHEQQHQELLLMDIKHVLSCNPLQPAYATVTVAAPTAQSPVRWIEHEGGLVEVGHTGPGFAFDNESPRHAVHLEPFALAGRPVTCGEWMAFMADGGYERPDLWLSDGWATVPGRRMGVPAVLVPRRRRLVVVHPGRTAAGRPGRARLPRELLRGRRLRPLERGAAAHRGRVGDGGGRRRGHRSRQLPRLHRPAPPAPDGTGSFFGDVWQWTSSAYSPYPGFHPAAGAVGEYNGKFMVNQYVLRGGCCVTPPDHIRATYRNFFPPSARWAFSGLRLARDC